MKNLMTWISIWWLEGRGYEVVDPCTNPFTEQEQEVWQECCDAFAVLDKDLKQTMARPTKYTKKLANEICAQLSGGDSLVKVCKSDAMPCRATIFNWFDDYPEFLDKYEKAKEECADYLVEEMLEIADNEVSQVVLVDGVPLVVDGEMVKQADQVGVAHARLRVDTRKWAASKLKPKKYGDKITNEVTGKGGAPIEMATTITFNGKSKDD